MNVRFDLAKVVDANGLLEALFEKKCRPTTRWLLQQRKAGRIPYSRCGRLVFYDPVKVRAVLFGKDSSGDPAQPPDEQKRTSHPL